MKAKWVWLVVAVALSASGVYVSGELLSSHLPGSDGSGWLHALCEADSGNVSCDKVLSSRWGVFPPLPADAVVGDGQPASGRIPTAYLGMAYFTLLVVWYALVGIPSASRRAWHLLPLAVNGVGLIGSIAFVVIMATQLKTWCPMCLATHGINLVLFVVTLMLWLTLRKEEVVRTPKPDAGGAAHGPAPDRAHPGARIVAACLALAAVAMVAEYQGSRIAGLSNENEKLTAVADEVRGSVESLLALFRNTEVQEIHIREDDPIRYDEPGVPTLVIWSDFECAHCKRFNNDFEHKYRKEFDNHIRIVFKNFPTNENCNRLIKGTPHPNACITAITAESARQLYGNEKFWEAHDYFFEVQEKLPELNPQIVAKRLGVEVGPLMAKAGTQEVGEHIHMDVKQGIRLGVVSTPGIFLDGRRVSPLARNVHGFWRELGKMYGKAREKREGKP